MATVLVGQNNHNSRTIIFVDPIMKFLLLFSLSSRLLSKKKQGVKYRIYLLFFIGVKLDQSSYGENIG
jgi:hypothetical protein